MNPLTTREQIDEAKAELAAMNRRSDALRAEIEAKIGAARALNAEVAALTIQRRDLKARYGALYEHVGRAEKALPPEVVNPSLGVPAPPEVTDPTQPRTRRSE